MKVRTVILSKMPKRVEMQSTPIVVLGLLVELVANNVLPFMLGVYFALTKSILFFGIFVFMLLFNIKIDTDKEKVEIKIIRGF